MGSVTVAAALRVKTLQSLFPGIKGRMQLVKVMLHLRMPELAEMGRDEPLDDELARRLELARDMFAMG